MIVLGVDPGHDGAAVCLVDGRAKYAWRWRRYGRKKPPTYLVEHNDPRGAFPTRHGSHMGLVAARIARACDEEASGGPHLLHIAVEGLFVGRNPAGSIAGAETAGKMLGEFEMHVVRPILRPKASTWRPIVLGLPENASSDLSEATAIQALNLKRGIIDGWMDLPKALRTDPHVCEAGAIARYAMITAERDSVAGRRR